MKKIVICTSKTDLVNNLVNILKNQYKVEVLDSSSKSYTVAYCSQFDLIIDLFNENETHKNNIIKQCSDAGIPVLCGAGSPSSYHPNNGAMLTLGLTDFNDQYHSTAEFLITNKRDVLKNFNYNKFSLKTKTYTIGSNLAPDIEPISYCESKTNYVVVNGAVFRKGKRNLKGEKFGSDCAFLGLPYDAESSDIMRDFTLEVVTWLLDISEIKVIIKETDGVQIVRDAMLHLKDTGYCVEKIKSNENGEFTLRCHGRNNEYYVATFDAETGRKNAVAIDKIKV